MTDVSLDFQTMLNEKVEAWENTLTTDCHEFQHIDGEEGDFGILRYLGTDLDGNPDVPMIIKYIHGGDHEESYLTPAGRGIMRKIMMENFEAALDKSLDDALDPGASRGMYYGWKADENRAARIAGEQGRKFITGLHAGYADLFPKEIVDGGLYRYEFKYFVAVVNGSEIQFYNINNPCEFLAFPSVSADGHEYKQTQASNALWAAAFGHREITTHVVEPV